MKKKCKILRKLANDIKAIKILPLSKHCKKKCISWTKKFMKTDFLTVILCRATLDKMYSCSQDFGYFHKWPNLGHSYPFSSSEAFFLE